MAQSIEDQIKAIKGQIEAARKELEKICNVNVDLMKRREQLSKEVTSGELINGNVADMEKLHAEHGQQIKQVGDLHSQFQALMGQLKDLIKEKAQADGNEIQFKKGKWYGEHQGLLDDLGDDANLLLCMDTEMPFYANSVKGNIEKAKELKRNAAIIDKENAEAAAELEKKKASADREKKANARPAPAQSVAGTMSPPTLPSQVSPNGPPQAHFVQAPVPQFQASAQFASADPLISQNEVYVRDKTIRELKEKVEELEKKGRGWRETIEELKSEKKEYKKKYQDQKKLTAKAEGEVVRLQAENGSRAGPNQEQQKVNEKMEANYHELLRTMRQGFADVTIEVLRSTRR